MHHSLSESPDLIRQNSRQNMELGKKTNRFLAFAKEGVNVTYAKTMYFCILLAVGFTWNINAVVKGPSGIDDSTDAKESYHQLFVTIIMAIGIVLLSMQLIKMKGKDNLRRHRPIPHHMSIVIWFLGILTVISEMWMAIR